jgi:hypothetical protein
MKPLEIQAGRSTPGIKFIPGDNILSIMGSSLPENVHIFYKPVIDWINELNPLSFSDKPLRIIFKLMYYNSGTIRCLAEILRAVKDLHEKGLNYSIEWHYDADDDIIREAGEELSEILEMEFDMIPNK